MMILVCILVGLLVGILINWAGDYLPRFASSGAALSSEPTPQPAPALSPVARTGPSAVLSPVACTEPSAVLSWHPELVEGLSQGRSEGPTLWYLLTSWRSWTCLQRSAWSGVAVELFSALLFAFLWVRFGASWRLLVLASYCSFLLLIAVIDLRHRLILNVLIYPAAVVAVLLRLVPSGEDALTTLLGGAVGLTFFSLVALLRRGEMGAGDVKLAALIGLMVGFPQVLWALTLGILAGGTAALFLLLTNLKELKSYMPYAPFLCLGAAITLVYNPVLPIPPF
ncbi:MAG: prepilin peptidase [Chloroflexi bacterium]|nr:prepilin peptidase [Chloroflexota bacterium]